MADAEPPFEQRLRAEGAEQRELHGGGHDPPDTEAAGEGSVNLTKQALSLRFNQEGFCDGLYSIAKPLAFAQFCASGSRFDGRVALGPAGEPAFGSAGRP